MSEPLRLDLTKYCVARHMCGCFVAIRFQDAVAALGLHTGSSVADGEGDGARGTARYIISGRGYVCDVYLHPRDTPDSCCLHLEYGCDDGLQDGTPGKPEVHLARVSAGLSAIFRESASEERSAQSYVSWDGEASAVKQLAAPPDWPEGVSIAGVRLIAPSQKSEAIVQQFPGEKGTATAVVSVEGGVGLSPLQVRAGFRATIRLAKAFRDAQWSVVEAEVRAYDGI
jgi:hypothetical protein